MIDRAKRNARQYKWNKANPDKIRANHKRWFDKYRGWICHNCNLALGNARDNPELLRCMASWLEKFEEVV